MSLNKIERRERIKMRIRKIVSGTPSQPRMTVYRSNKQIYVQFIDDLAGVTLATASSLDKAGDHTAYEQVMAAVSDFEKGNMRLSVVLSSLEVK